MMLRGRLVLALVIAAAATMVLVSPAAAAHVGCGQTITQTTVLHDDLGPCPNNGLIIATDGVKLDLNGHAIVGTAGTGDGAGVLVRNARGVKVTNGTVRGFDGGVVIENGGGNSVTKVTARDNIGQSAAQFALVNRYGDGIAVLGSSDNHIADNTTVNNGPFSGIGLYERPDADHSYPAAPTERNSVMGNVVEDNQACRISRTTGARSTCDNDGIRVEPGAGPDNVTKDNVVRRNGLDGIALFSDADGNVVMRNLVEGNGRWGAVAGDGIRVFGSFNTIHRNEAYDNASAGISVGRRTGAAMGSLPNNATTGNPRGIGNNIMRNVALHNIRYDLWDSNPCGLNTWKRNTFVFGAYCVE
jgi:parallel beta-helix repeat protein